MNKKVDKAKHREFLQLVVDGGKKVDRNIIEKSLNPENVQYEMFGSSNSVLFTEARNIDLSQIKDLIYKYHIHHIVDLREVPYLNFGRSNRKAFFKCLYSASVDYLSLISVASKTKKSSVNEFLKDHDCSELLSEEIGEWIENGPTLVFIGQEKEDDNLAKSFSSLLNKSKISYSEIVN
jgi:hypothetical protein